VLRHFLALDQALDQLVSAQELLDFVQVGLEVLEFLLRAQGFDRALRSAFHPGLHRGCGAAERRRMRPTRLRRL